jgi:hypothetical protein
MYGMQSIIWAFGSLVVLLGIISFLPIGLTLKGKIVVGITGFILSIGGLAANSTFPLWTTFLLLLVITFFSAYIIDSRMRKILYTEKISPEKEIFHDIDVSLLSNKNVRREQLSDIDLIEINNAEEDSLLELTVPELLISVEKKDAPDLPSLDESKLDEIQFTNIDGTLDELFIEETLELSPISDIDKDSVFEEILDADLSKSSQFNNADLEDGYLSEIESLLDEHQMEQQDDKVSELLSFQSEKENEIGEENWLNELSESEVISNDEKNESIEFELQDSELEILLATKEVAASNEEQEPEKKLVELRK